MTTAVSRAFHPAVFPWSFLCEECTW